LRASLLLGTSEEQVDIDTLNEALAIVSGTTGPSLLRFQEDSPSSAVFVAAGDSGTWQVSGRADAVL